MWEIVFDITMYYDVLRYAVSEMTAKQEKLRGSEQIIHHIWREAKNNVEFVTNVYTQSQRENLRRKSIFISIQMF